MFVPSTSDAGPAAILPRPPLPEPLIADARELLPNAIFASNPCRIRFYNQASARLSQAGNLSTSLTNPLISCYASHSAVHPQKSLLHPLLVRLSPATVSETDFILV